MNGFPGGTCCECGKPRSIWEVVNENLPPPCFAVVPLMNVIPLRVFCIYFKLFSDSCGLLGLAGRERRGQRRPRGPCGLGFPSMNSSPLNMHCEDLLIGHSLGGCCKGKCRI